MLSLRIQTNIHTVRSFWKNQSQKKSHKKTKDLARYFERTLFIIIIIKNDCYNNKKKNKRFFLSMLLLLSVVVVVVECQTNKPNQLLYIQKRKRKMPRVFLINFRFLLQKKKPHNKKYKNENQANVNIEKKWLQKKL